MGKDILNLAMVYVVKTATVVGYQGLRERTERRSFYSGFKVLASLSLNTATVTRRKWLPGQETRKHGAGSVRVMSLFDKKLGFGTYY